MDCLVSWDSAGSSWSCEDNSWCVNLTFSVSYSHLNSDSTSTLTVAISNTSYSSSSPIKLLLSSNKQISSPPESSGYSEELCTFLRSIQSANQPGKNEREHMSRAQGWWHRFHPEPVCLAGQHAFEIHLQKVSWWLTKFLLKGGWMTGRKFVAPQGHICEDVLGLML